MDQDRPALVNGAKPRQRRRLIGLLIIGTLLGLAGGCSAIRDERAEAKSPQVWATPLTIPGVGNFHRLNENLYRGEQPTAEGSHQLAAMGIRTLVNLRNFHNERSLAKAAGLDYVYIPLEAWIAPLDDEVVAFLKVAADPRRCPVFVHCQFGADRTGTMCAAYRIVVENWSKDDAIAEMKLGGFHWHNFTVLERYLRGMDPAGIRNKLKSASSMPETAATTAGD